MKSNLDQLKALSELSWLAIIRLSLSLFNHISNEWNKHPYFKNLGTLPVVNNPDLEKLFVSAVANSVGHGGKMVSPQALEAETREFFHKNALNTYKGSILPEPAVRMCADIALQKINVSGIAKSMYAFASLHSDIIAPLMLAMMKKLTSEHPNTTIHLEMVDDAFVADAFKRVGVEKMLPLLQAARRETVDEIVNSISEVRDEQIKHIDQFVMLVIADFAKKKLI